MAWYDTGTIAVTNGSTAVVGTGTQWVTGAQVGEAMLIDNVLYEIQSIVSATSLTLADNYLAATQSGLTYKIVPTQSLVADLASDVTNLISDYATIANNAGAGKFNDGTVTSPGIQFLQDSDNGLYRIGSDNWGLVAGGAKIVDVDTSGIDVTGTATMDGLVVNSGTPNVAATFTSSDDTVSLVLTDNDTTNNIHSSATGLRFEINGSETGRFDSAGIDVTGTATMDGLVVDGEGRIEEAGAAARLTIARTDAANSAESASLDLMENNAANLSFGDVASFGYRLEVDGSTNKFNILSGNQTATKKRFSIDRDTGDLSLYEDTGTTAKFHWDASAEKLNLTGTGGLDVTGTATMDGLTVNGVGSITALSDNAVFNVNVSGGTSKTSTINQRAKSSNGSNADTSIVVTGSSGESVSAWDFKLDTANGALTKAMSIDGSGDISFYEDTGTTAKLFWDASAESLGIGTSSPQDTGTAYGDLTLNGASGGFLSFTDDDVLKAQLGSVIGEFRLQTKATGGYMTFRTDTGASGTEAMRIDSSGHVLVGGTATSPGAGNATTGISLRGGTDNRSFFSVNENYVMHINRKGNDGDIVKFAKDGTTVGSISVVNGNNLTIGGAVTGHAGIQFGSDRIIPESAGTQSDALTDLGQASGRFKDLYLSGGVYLGGTGAANKLDDFETGTWTPTASSYDGTMTVTSATYVKVGKLVTVKANVSFDATADGSGVNLSNLPFTSTGTAKANGGFVTSSTVSSAVRIQAVGTSSLFLVTTDNTNVTYTTMASTTLEFVMIYEAA